MSPLRGLMVGIVLAAASACGSSDITPPPVRSTPAIAGAWKQENLRAGTYRILDLVNHDSLVDGVGQYREFNQSADTLTVSGLLRGTQVTLDIAQGDGTHLRFNGTLVRPDRMSGWLSSTSDSVTATFQYLAID